MNRKSLPLSLTVILPFLAVTFLPDAAMATDKVTALDIEIVPPTVVSGGVDWKIFGDDNRNASVKVEYRKVGSTQWEDGLDLFRLQNEDMNPYPGGIATDPNPSRGGQGALMMRPLIMCTHIKATARRLAHCTTSPVGGDSLPRVQSRAAPAS